MSLHDDAQAAIDAYQAALNADDASKADLTAKLAAAQAATDAAAAADATEDAAYEAKIADLKAQVAALTPPPPAPSTVYSAYAGPGDVKNSYNGPADYARVAAAFGVSVLPVERVYSEGGYGKAAGSKSPVVAVSYKQVPGFAANDANVIAAMTTELKALGATTSKKFYVSMDHEVDNKVKGGTYSAATYKAAAGRFYSLVKSLNLPNVKVAVCYMGWSFSQATSNPWHPVNLYAPGQADLIALDPYWTLNLTSVTAFLDPGFNWAATTGLPVAIWEIGDNLTVAQPISAATAATVADHVAKIIAYADAHKAVHVLWFEANKTDGDHRITTLPAACAEWAAAVQRK